MARNTQLLQLVDQLRSELGASVNPSQGLNTLATHKYKLKVAQEFLYYDYAWPFLKEPGDVVMQAGQRYYDLPVAAEGIKRVEYKWGDTWAPLKQGIGGPEYSAEDSEDDERADPVRAWQFYGLNQFEVWPLPATNDLCTVRFYGTRVLTPLVADNSRALLDDRLIVLYAAWSLSPKEQRDNRLKDFNTYYSALKRRSTNKSRGIVLGGAGGGACPESPTTVRVAVDRGEN